MRLALALLPFGLVILTVVTLIGAAPGSPVPAPVETREAFLLVQCDQAYDLFVTFTDGTVRRYLPGHQHQAEALKVRPHIVWLPAPVDGCPDPEEDWSVL